MSVVRCRCPHRHERNDQGSSKAAVTSYQRLTTIGRDIGALGWRLEPGDQLRSPREAKPRFEAITEAGVPTLVVSGEHHPGLERLCDAITTRLDAQRARLPGAGHEVQHVPGLNAMLETFLRAAEHVRVAGESYRGYG